MKLRTIRNINRTLVCLLWLNLLPIALASVVVAFEFLSEVRWNVTPKNTSKGLWQIEYGTKPPGRLAYVFFSGTRLNQNDGLPWRVQVRHDNSVLLHKSDASTLALTPGSPVHQYVDGAWQTFDLRVTVDQVRAFIDSDQKEYTVEALLQFLQKAKAN